MTATIICWGCRPGRSSWPAGCPAKVAPDCHIVVDKVLYSVPWTHVGASTDTRVTDTTVAVHVDGKLVKTWPKAQRGRCTDEADYPPEKIAFFSRNRSGADPEPAIWVRTSPSWWTPSSRCRRCTDCA